MTIKLLFTTIIITILFSACNKNKPATLTIMGNSEISNITSNSAVVTGTTLEIGENMQAYGHVWGENENPDISNFKSEQKDTEVGTFVDKLTNLKPETKYYVRTYAKDGEDVVYKDAVSFTTLTEQSVLLVVTNDPTGISYESAICSGNVINEGESAVSVKGFCYSTSENPTIEDLYTENGSGTDSYNFELTELTDNTTYYVRAYATNSEGTVYGEQKAFTTLAYSTPNIITSEILDIDLTIAWSGGNVTNNGGKEVNTRGVCWSSSENPTVDDTKTINGNGNGTFASKMDELTENTTYYVRAYATNEIGTAYGEQKTFTTLKTHAIGDFYEGGVIFYLDATGQHGLVCAISDQSKSLFWHANDYTYCGADGMLLGEGETNTNTIAEHQTITGASAAKLCYDLELNNYSDWFLPSKDELDSMYINKVKINVTIEANSGDILENSYWSSTEVVDSVDKAMSQFFSTGDKQESLKNNTSAVRAVRAF